MDKTQESLDRATDIYRAHDCQACHDGGATAILRHLNDIREDACRKAGASVHYADRLSRTFRAKV